MSGEGEERRALYLGREVVYLGRYRGTAARIRYPRERVVHVVPADRVVFPPFAAAASSRSASVPPQGVSAAASSDGGGQDGSGRQLDQSRSNGHSRRSKRSIARRPAA